MMPEIRWGRLSDLGDSFINLVNIALEPSFVSADSFKKFEGNTTAGAEGFYMMYKGGNAFDSYGILFNKHLGIAFIKREYSTGLWFYKKAIGYPSFI